MLKEFLKQFATNLGGALLLILVIGVIVGLFLLPVAIEELTGVDGLGFAVIGFYIVLICATTAYADAKRKA